MRETKCLFPCGKNRGFVMTEILDVHHGGSKNDTLCCKEVKL